MAWKAKYRIDGDTNNNFRITTDPETNEGLLYVDKVSTPSPPRSPLSAGPSRTLRHVYPAARGLSGPDQLTSNYFGLFSFAGGQPGIPAERQREG